MISDYSERFGLYEITKTQEPVYGDPVESESLVDTYWGWIEYKSASQPIIEGGKNQVIVAVAHLHNILDISVTSEIDYLGTRYSIEGVTWGDDETILELRRIQE